MSRIDDIEREIRECIERGLIEKCPHSIAQRIEFAANVAAAIKTELVDRHLIGLPCDLPRTSVRTDLVAQLGQLHDCRANEDADDVLKAAIAAEEHG